MSGKNEAARPEDLRSFRIAGLIGQTKPFNLNLDEIVVSGDYLVINMKNGDPWVVLRVQCLGLIEVFNGA